VDIRCQSTEARNAVLVQIRLCLGRRDQVVVAGLKSGWSSETGKESPKEGEGKSVL
jgi:hypothetical protein